MPSMEHPVSQMSPNAPHTSLSRWMPMAKSAVSPLREACCISQSNTRPTRIAMAKPGKKMSSEGKDWKTNGYTQIRWGLKYIQGRYGSPSKAWKHFQKRHWY